MKKTTFTLVLALSALATLPALAQQKGAPAPAQDPVTKIATAAPKALPVAEYYEGGQEALNAFIAKELKYPLLARRNRIQGTCIVSFTLTPDGTLSGVKLVKQVGGGTGEEALRVVKLLQFKKPEYPILTSLPVVFKLGAAGPNTAAE